ncbi:MAG: hypothetical protein AB7F28_08690 [Candidatus Margulisiibacteriota bacterium]
MKKILSFFKKMYLAALIFIIVVESIFSLMIIIGPPNHDMVVHLAFVHYIPFQIIAIPCGTYLVWLLFSGQFETLPKKRKRYLLFIVLAPYIGFLVDFFMMNIRLWI